MMEKVPDHPPPMTLLFIPLILKGTTHFALLDSGASDSLISADVVKQTGLHPRQSGKWPILVYVALCTCDSNCVNPEP